MPTSELHYFYVLYSLKDHKFYKGYSSDIGKRFLRHNAGGAPSTQSRRPLLLIYLEQFDSRTQALARETWAKSAQGGRELVELLLARGILNDEKENWLERPAEGREFKSPPRYLKT